MVEDTIASGGPATLNSEMGEERVSHAASEQDASKPYCTGTTCTRESQEHALICCVQS